MSRIATDALPTLETLTDEQLAELFGRGLKKSDLSVTHLEGREMMSVTAIQFSGSAINVFTDNAGTNVKFDQLGSTVRITNVGTGQFWDRSLAGINALQFIGGAGNDKVQNTSNINMNAWGNAGDDVLIGGGGNDQLIGGAGDDQLIGRGGSDKMWGGTGTNVYVAIDGGTGDAMYLDAAATNDTVWRDKNGVLFFSFTDTVSGANASTKIHDVAGFANPNADRTLDGDSITDPAVMAGQHTTKFANNPLFSTSGPRITDIKQGNYADCWLLAGLGAIANDHATVLKQNIVDFQDGTYGVKLGSSFYRVDSYLPVFNGTSNLSAAGLGAQNSMWVAITEKAYAFYRTGANSYASLEYGWAGDVNKAFGSTSTGSKSLGSYANATDLANDIYNRWNSYQCVTMGFGSVKPGYGSTNPLVMGHAYTVYSVTRVNGVVTSITLRNPWGVDGGGNNDGNNDGFVTVTPATLFKYLGDLTWGKV